MTRIRKSWPRRQIIIDTREQQPWRFPTERTIRRALTHGDYSLDTLTNIVCIERKSLQDLVGSLNTRRSGDQRSRRDRLKDEFAWLGENVRWPFLIFEASWEDIAKQRYRGELNPSAVIGTLVSWSMRFGVHVVPGGDRHHAFAIANRVLRKAEELFDEERVEEGNGGADQSVVDVQGQRSAGRQRTRR